MAFRENDLPLNGTYHLNIRVVIFLEVISIASCEYLIYYRNFSSFHHLSILMYGNH